MSYKTSKDYERLRALLDNRKYVIVICWHCVYFACYDKYKGYYIGDSWLEHDIEWSQFADKDPDALRDFCERHELEFIDPADYSGCVQPEPDRRTQTALRPADGTQRRSVWHDCEDIPQDFNHDVIAVTINGTWFRMPVSDLWAFLTCNRAMIRRWAYIDDLEAL